MKKNKHPKYQEVLFVDSTTGHRFVCGSTLQPKDSEEFQGKTYPVCRVSISSASHPFFTGSGQFVDAEGRVDQFKRRYMKQQQQNEANAAAAAEKKPVKASSKRKTN